MSSNRTVHIISDGTADSTRVLNNDGVEIKGVIAIQAEAAIREDGLLRITLEVLAPTMDADGILDTTMLTCPLCREQQHHNCSV